ncbi:type II secretion system GspH family protein [bacterium]|nr:type II secretion system GspH family protein [bacterium]
MFYSKRGFSLLEIIVAIFLIAVVLATILMLMSANMNVISKANELMIANALEQYTIEDVKNIEFPPIYCDRQASFGDRPGNGTYKKPDEVDPEEDGDNWAPSGFEKDFIVRKYDFRYSWDNTFFDGSIVNDTDLTMYHQIDIYILRKKDKYTVSKNSIIISRDGAE